MRVPVEDKTGLEGAYDFTIFFSTINRAAVVFAALFVSEGLLLLWTGVVQRRIHFHVKADLSGILGLTLITYALLADAPSDLANCVSGAPLVAVIQTAPNIHATVTRLIARRSSSPRGCARDGSGPQHRKLG